MVNLRGNSPPSGDTGDRPRAGAGTRRRLLRAGRVLGRVHVVLQRLPSASSTHDLESAGVDVRSAGYRTLGDQLVVIGHRDAF